MREDRFGWFGYAGSYEDEWYAEQAARRDQLQQMAYRRLRLLRDDTRSHEDQIGEGTALCRTGGRCDPSARELREACQGCAPKGKNAA